MLYCPAEVFLSKNAAVNASAVKELPPLSGEGDRPAVEGSIKCTSPFLNADRFVSAWLTVGSA